MKTESGESPPMLALRKHALSFPEVEEGSSCVKRAFKARNKAFFYLGMRDDTYNIMVKLVGSLDDAAELESADPETYRVGKHGWTTVVYSHDVFPPRGLIEGWIEESYRALVHKDLVAQLSDESPTVPAKRKAAGKKASRKKTAKKKPARKKSTKKKATKRKTAKKRKSARKKRAS